jgi:hypothetical protein
MGVLCGLKLESAAEDVVQWQVSEKQHDSMERDKRINY